MNCIAEQTKIFGHKVDNARLLSTRKREVGDTNLISLHFVLLNGGHIL